MSLQNSKNKPKSQIAMPLQRSWETLNLKATSIPTSAREGLEFLTGIVIGVGMSLIQWTSVNRYNNLGKFCNKYDCDPSSLEGQTRYMINEISSNATCLSLKVVVRLLTSIWFLLTIGWDGVSKDIVNNMHTNTLRNWYWHD